jgi:hypothetical protein
MVDDLGLTGSDHILALRQEHRDLDVAISALVSAGSADQLQIQRLKKKKLLLRDEIERLADTTIPDIIA